MNCKECGNKYPSSYTYCPNDGHKLGVPEESFTYKYNEYCTSCNQQNKEEYPSCKNCGHSLLQRVVQKKGFQETISKTIVPEIKKSLNRVDLNRSKNFIQNLNFKRDWLLCIPIFLAIIVILTMPISIIKSFLKNKGFLDNSEIAYILEPGRLSSLISEEAGHHVVIPNIMNIFALTNQVHNIKTEFSFSAFLADNLISGSVNGLMTSMLVLPILALLISGIILGVIAKKYKLSLIAGVFFSTVIYTIFLWISSIAGAAKLDGKLNSYFLFSITYSQWDAIVTGLALSAIFVTVGAVLAYYNRDIVTFLQEQISAIGYAISVVCITMVGLLVNMIYSNSLLKSSKEIEMDEAYFIPLIHGPISVIHFLMTQFNSLKFSTSGDGDFGDIKTNWLFGNTLTGSVEGFDLFNNILLIDKSIIGSKSILVLITVLLIASIGYFFYNRHQLQWKEIAKFAVIFAIVQCFIIYLTNVDISFGRNGDVYRLSMEFSYIMTFITSFTISGLSFTLGGYVYKLFK
ncbi:zinc ribbon domain-containing protein [Viridibacillus sp. YIM B01967]|uniref:Zinc ribbon domain-containing protein n=1 Tax=Viridibacillus soli TaxID=2798301 RepID=A0ABS1H6H9_9BACL|nr:zinc ribbon domain-containing protein [Viridibacillus soli]MBK3495017.1 zinc ribbon domain-containing protein [Viridibacillus soli]